MIIKNKTSHFIKTLRAYLEESAISFAMGKVSKNGNCEYLRQIENDYLESLSR